MPESYAQKRAQLPLSRQVADKRGESVSAPFSLEYQNPYTRLLVSQTRQRYSKYLYKCKHIFKNNLLNTLPPVNIFLYSHTLYYAFLHYQNYLYFMTNGL